MTTTLYLGLELPREPLPGKVIHYPIIKIVPRPASDPFILTALAALKDYTHILLTSKVAVRLFVSQLESSGNSLASVKDKQFIAVGLATAKAMAQHGIKAIVPQEETSEGITALLATMTWQHQYMLWWHSALSRSVLRDFLQSHNIRHCDCIAYDTVPNSIEPLPHLEEVDEIIFTSPSTVDAFVTLFGSIPCHKTITPIGSITAAHLARINSR